MCRFRHFAEFVLAALIASACCSPAAFARFFELPLGWTDEVREDLWIVRSPRDVRGGVDFVVSVAIPFGGDFHTWFSDLAPRVAAALGGRVVSQGLQETTIGNRRTDGLISSMRLVAEDASGQRSSVIVMAYRGDTVRPEHSGKAQVIAIAAPSAVANAIADATGLTDHRWQQAIEYAERIALIYRLVLTPEMIAQARAIDARYQQGGAGQQQAPSQAPPAAGDVAPSSVWSARSGGRGVVFLSPCRAGLQPVVAGVRRREYMQALNLPALVRDEARDAVRAWSGGASPSFAGQEQDAATAAVVTRFKMQGRDFAAWFAVRKRSDNHVQLGFVLLPADRAQDGAVAEAVATVRSELENESAAELGLEGASPAPSTDPGVEAVLALSGLALAEENRALSIQSTAIALYRNGLATDTARRLRGRWQRLEGAYEVDFTDAGGYAARLSTSCLSSAAVANAPPAPPTPAGQKGQSTKGCRFELVRKTNYAIFCGTLPGTVAPRTCPPPTSTWVKEMVCN